MMKDRNFRGSAVRFLWGGGLPASGQAFMVCLWAKRKRCYLKLGVLAEHARKCFVCELFVSPPPFLLVVSRVEVVFFLAHVKQQFGLCRAFASEELTSMLVRLQVQKKHTGSQVISQITVLSPHKSCTGEGILKIC